MQVNTIDTLLESLNQHLPVTPESTSASQLVLDYLEQKVLCVEVGGTRIKAAVLPKITTLDELKKIHTIAFPSKPWLNKDLPLLFKRTVNNPLFTQLPTPYSLISLSITGPVFANRTYLANNRHGLPEELCKACEQEAAADVTIENDVICWAKGSLEYLKLKSIKPQYPCLGLTLGTGVGIAFMQDEHTFCGIELSFIDGPFPRLLPLTKEQPFQKWSAHLALGRAFFNWLFSGEQFTDEQMAPHLAHYNDRVYAFVQDIQDFIQKTFKTTTRSLLIGGGFSRFIQVPANDTSTLVLGPHQLEVDGVSADIIQLLGCQVSGTSSSLYPSHDEMQRRMKEDRCQ